MNKPQTTDNENGAVVPLHINELIRLGFLLVGRLEQVGDTGAVKTTLDGDTGSWQKTIYAIVFGEFVWRIGSSQGALLNRHRVTDRYVSLFMKGQCPTDKHGNEKVMHRREMKIWQECMKRHRLAMIYARFGNTSNNEFGEYSDYLSLENLLLSRHKLFLNNSHSR
jgi:hypothetical protein